MGAVTPAAVHALAVAAGLSAEAAVTATAIAWAESGLRPDAVGDVDLADGTWGPSMGLWQVRSLRAHTGTGAERDVERLGDPAFNARAMAVISGGGTNWSPWSVWKNGRYAEHLAAVRAAVKGGGPVPIVDIIAGAMADLEARGYKVTYVEGWQARGRPGSFEPGGLVLHHTATSRSRPGDYPSLDLIVNGRPDLSGPLSQFGLGRSGRVYVVAAGKANHAGPGGWHHLSGNGSVWGIEAENDGIGEPWPAAQIDAYLAAAAALARHTGFGPAEICAHREWNPVDKIDPTGIDADEFRSRVAALLSGTPDTPTPDPSEEDTMRLIGVTDNRGIYLISGSIQASGKAKGKALARYVGTPADVEALVASGVVEQYNQLPDLPGALFDRYFSVVT